MYPAVPQGARGQKAARLLEGTSTSLEHRPEPWKALSSPPVLFLQASASLLFPSG